MKENGVLEILKQAILLERRGKAFYNKIAEQSENKAVRDFFETMAAEEQKHMQMLSEQFKAYRQQRQFVPGGFSENDTSQVASNILTQEIKAKISAAGFEAAAISAAIAMEERAIELYAQGAQASEDPEAKALYAWLSNWERDHLNALLDIDKALKEKVWFDRKFWPF